VNHKEVRNKILKNSLEQSENLASGHIPRKGSWTFFSIYRVLLNFQFRDTLILLAILLGKSGW
jgi:hypothetical protein